MKDNTIEILMRANISEDELHYIADCWATFVTQDLGRKVSDLIMMLPDGQPTNQPINLIKE